jgi:hypothetical protein
MDSLTQTLLQTIGNPLLTDYVPVDVTESRELFEYAFSNNVEMIYRDALIKAGKLSSLQQEFDGIIDRQRYTLKTISRLVATLDACDIPYGITKTLRPFAGTPNDIDCLYLGPLDKYEDASQKLVANDYRITAPNDMQYEFFDTQGEVEFDKDKSGGKFYIDFYRELAADHMPYMDSAVLINCREKIHVEGCEHPVDVFIPKAEIAILALHSVVMHRTIPLEVIYTYSYYFSEMSDQEIEEVWRFVKANHAEPAFRAVITVMVDLFDSCFGEVPDKLSLIAGLAGRSKLESRELEKTGQYMPHIASLRTFVFAVFSKIRGKRSRQGFFKELFHMLNPVFAVEVLHHMFSRKWVKKHSQHVK